MSDLMDLRLLEHFTVVYRHGSFSRAAEEIGLSQSSLTKRVQLLENDLGVALFWRSTRNVRPTEAGSRLYLLALDLLAQSKTARQKVIGTDRRLKIMGGQPVIETLLIPAIGAFRAKCPDVRMSVLAIPPALAAEQLIQRRAQIIVFHTEVIKRLPIGETAVRHELTREPLRVGCRKGHPALQTDRSLSALMEFDWAICGRPDFIATLAMGEALGGETVASLTANKFPKYFIDSTSGLLDLIRRGDVLTMAGASIFSGLTETDALEVFDVDWLGETGSSFSAVTLPETMEDPVVLAFLEALQAGPGAC